MRAKRWLLASFSLTALLGCGGDVSVAVSFGDATFMAPFVASAVTLSFRRTVVNETKQADTDSTGVIVQP